MKENMQISTVFYHADMDGLLSAMIYSWCEVSGGGGHKHAAGFSNEEIYKQCKYVEEEALCNLKSV